MCELGLQVYFTSVERIKTSRWIKHDQPKQGSEVYNYLYIESFLKEDKDTHDYWQKVEEGDFDVQMDDSSITFLLGG